jgi:heterodisulfide reductase subunit C
MVADYLGSDDPGDVAAISALWQKEYGVVLNAPVPDNDPVVMDAGRTLNEESCQVCHSSPQSAFVSYAVARSVGGASRRFNRLRMDLILWHVHYLSCFALLALAPFGKLYHLISTPLTLWMRRTEYAVDRMPAAWMEGCTHCGVCNRQCSVVPAYRILGLPEILPSEKLMALRTQSRRRRSDAASLRALACGNAICTRCYRCTQHCPSGINLQHLWSYADQWVAGTGLSDAPVAAPEPGGSLGTDSVANIRRPHRDHPETMPRYPLLNAPRAQLFHCVQCSTCSGCCPVVAAAGAGETELDITPQQVMNLLRLGHRDLALESIMVRECVTCYQCQELCPQGIAVADILYELRNDAWSRAASRPVAHKPV